MREQLAWMASRAAGIVLLLLIHSSSTTGHWQLTGTAAAAPSASQSHQRQGQLAHALLGNYQRPVKEDDEPLGAVGAPSAWMYRMLAGTWLDFKKEAGGMDDSQALCATARQAVACATRTPKPQGGAQARDWKDDRR